MISSDKRQTALALKKLIDDSSEVFLVYFPARGGISRGFGKITLVKDGSFTFLRRGNLQVTIDFNGATVTYGEAREVRSSFGGKLGSLEPDAMALDFRLPSGDRCLLLELRKAE